MSQQHSQQSAQHSQPSSQTKQQQRAAKLVDRQFWLYGVEKCVLTMRPSSPYPSSLSQ